MALTRDQWQGLNLKPRRPSRTSIGLLRQATKAYGLAYVQKNVKTVASLLPIRGREAQKKLTAFLNGFGPYVAAQLPAAKKAAKKTGGRVVAIGSRRVRSRPAAVADAPAAQAS